MAATLDPEPPRVRLEADHYTWKNAPAGEHTLVSRSTLSNGEVQPTADRDRKQKTFLEDNSQSPAQNRHRLALVARRATTGSTVVALRAGNRTKSPATTTAPQARLPASFHAPGPP